MKFDLRVPVGALFSLYGAMLSLYGLFGDRAQYARSLGININLIWGLIMLAGGALTLTAVYVSRSSQAEARVKGSPRQTRESSV